MVWCVNESDITDYMYGLLCVSLAICLDMLYVFYLDGYPCAYVVDWELILCLPLLLLPSIFPSINVFSNESSVQFSRSVVSDSL